MPDALSPVALRFGVAAAVTVALLCLAYASVLTVGLLTLPSPDHQIQQPWFTLMELLIIAIAPAMVALTVVLHARAPQPRKSLAMTAVAFMSMTAVVTCAVHFAVLTLSRQTAFAGQEWAPLVFSFTWPSVAYALDILAWDFFFPLAALFAATSIQGAGLAAVVRGLLFASAAMAFMGLSGVVLGTMQLRNIGIIGYAVIFPVASAFAARLFRQASNESVA